MKSELFAKVLMLTAALAIALTPGCRRKQKILTPLAAQTGPIENPGIGGPNDLDTTGLGQDSPIAGAPLATGTNPNSNIALGSDPLPRDQYNVDRSAFAANVVYFDHDSAVIKNSEKGKLTTVANALRSNSRVAIEVEGHCDERGTEEYNRSLGERRALAVREEIALNGIDPRRVYTISYGEDSPAVDGHDEFSWSRNRRGEIVLLNPR